MPDHADHARSRLDARIRQARRSGGRAPLPLDAADAAFRALVTGPRPLALNPGRLAAGLPDRMMPLGELRALLLHPSTPGRGRDAGAAPRRRVPVSGLAR